MRKYIFIKIALLFGFCATGQNFDPEYQQSPTNQGIHNQHQQGFGQTDPHHQTHDEAEEEREYREEPKEEIITYKQAEGFTLGVNLEGPINTISDNKQTSISFNTRINISEYIFFHGEIGFQNVNFEKSEYHYDSNGTFIKAGFENDILKKRERGLNDNLLIGIHYGYAFQQHGASHINFENEYWGDYSSSLSTYSLDTHWIELSFGPRIEIVKNFYIGWHLHLKATIFTNNRYDLNPYFIPGYGNGDSSVNAGFSYKLEYMIPWSN
ncbi:DUF6048 family protein [Marinilabiliaceae bacterium ANBcel2]|nr:DUF6048 family protein [Marinilabiliaceae bacterium ANBcel2]